MKTEHWSGQIGQKGGDKLFSASLYLLITFLALFQGELNGESWNETKVRTGPGIYPKLGI